MWSAVSDHFACYPVISWTFVVLQFVHGLLYFFYQYITLTVSKWWRDVFQLFDKVIGYLLVKLCHVEFAAVRCPSLYYVVLYCRPRVSHILARPVIVNRAADQMLHVSNANHDQCSSSPACVIRQTADVAINTLSNLPIVVDDSSSMAVAKDVHDFVESKPSANAGVNVTTNNVCEKSVDAVNHSSDKLVQSVTVKSGSETCDDVCAPKDHHHHHHRQPWAQCPLVSDAILTIAAHRCLSRAAWLNSCRVAPHHCSMSSDHSR